MEKEIVPMSRQARALKAVASNELEAECNALVVLSVAVMSGDAIEPDFQLLVNAIVARCMIYQKLPLPAKKKGRPNNDASQEARDIALEYFKLKDEGVGYSDAVSSIAAVVHKDERSIMRLVKKGKPFVGKSVEARKQQRDWTALMADVYKRQIDAGGESRINYLVRTSKEIEQESLALFAEVADGLIDRALDPASVTDKYAGRFIASD